MTTLSGVAEAYLGRVREELGDLPASELEEVLDDVAGHLDEVVRELGDEMTSKDLQDRLGTPETYAAELRDAAAYPAPPRVRHNSRGGIAVALGAISAALLSFFVAAWIDADLGIGDMLALAAIGLVPALLGVLALNRRPPELVTELRLWRWAADRLARIAEALPMSLRRDLVSVGQPGWWVLRGVLVGTGGYLLAVGHDIGWEVNLPGLVSSALIGIVVSVWLGRRSQRDRRWLWLLAPVNVALVVAMISVAVTGSWRTIASRADGDPISNPTYESPAGLWLNGDQLTNLFAFDENGKVLKNIRLYDSVGSPLVLTGIGCSRAGLGEVETQDNIFPKPGTQVADDGNCTETVKPEFAVPPLQR